MTEYGVPPQRSHLCGTCGRIWGLSMDRRHAVRIDGGGFATLPMRIDGMFQCCETGEPWCWDPSSAG